MRELAVEYSRMLVHMNVQVCVCVVMCVCDENMNACKGFFYM
jgi:hypothetical protein